MTTEIADRLASLEKSLLRCRLLTVASLLLAGAALLWVWRTPRNNLVANGGTIEATKFVLKDASGLVRGSWGMNVLNKPALTMGWPGFNNIYLGEGRYGASLVLWGGARASIAAHKDDASVHLDGRPVPEPVAGSEWFSPDEYSTEGNTNYARIGSGAEQFILQSRFGGVQMDSGRSEDTGPTFKMRNAGENLPGFEAIYGPFKKWAARIRLPGSGPGERYYELPPAP